MTKILTDRKTLTQIARESFAFEAFDAKGRQIGCIVQRNEVEFVAAPEGQTWGWTSMEGHYYAARVEASRDGKVYGASQPTRYFVTKDEAEAFIAKRVDASRKAAAKKAA
jgi:hypothetical protein